MLRPKKGEGKQAFMKRAVSELMKQGKKEADAMAEAARLWNSANLSAEEAGVFTLSCVKPVQLSEGAGEGKPRRFSILANTGGVNDLGYYRFVLNMSGCKHHAKFPALYEHDRKQIAGYHDSVKTGKEGLILSGQFVDTAIAREIIKIADEGYPWQSSVGVWQLQTRFLKTGEKATVNGQTFEGPLEIWDEWKLNENSFCSIGVDDETAAIVMSRENHNPEVTVMYSRELKLALGLAADATDAEVRAKLAAMQLAEDATEAQVFAHLLAQKPNAEPDKGGKDLSQPGGTVPAQPAPADLSAEVARQLAIEKERSSGIMGLAVRLGLSKEWAQDLIDKSTSLADARTLAIEEATKGNSPFGAGRLSEGATDSDKFRKLASAGIGLRFGMGDASKADNDTMQYSRMGLLALASLCLQRGGMNTMLLGKEEIARKVLSRSFNLAASTSDFKSIMMDVAHKRMLESYGIVEETWRTFCDVVTATDFKDMHGVSLDGAPELLAVPESGEYKSAVLSDGKESYRIAKYGRVIPLTWEAIVNDDMRAFMKIPGMFGSAAARLVLDIVYGLLKSNPVLGDGKALFHVDRGNIATGADIGRVTMGTLKAMRKAMGTRADRSGNMVKVTPSTLIISMDQATDVDVLLTSAANPEGANSGVNNPFRNAFMPVADPHVDEIHDNAWFAFAKPGQFDGIEVAFLDGKQQPELTEDESFDSDSIRYKARLCCGAGVMGTLGCYYNPGVSE
ncbi:phage protease [Desulfovibrio mangrovi]|uniref:phage major capsid protein n=1 Tax=Desulfovibrio mangrovi TaxID=2976983 RepID=UPI0022475720|nr:hypothetical protein [Desulfovibrio mangrovi]UZP67724.1 phage protease [Desulfovibrio mangrovi]